jgi:methylase of polypeptide subunit release factors
LIISNPPWIISKPIDEKDPGNYDEKGDFLKGLF